MGQTRSLRSIPGAQPSKLGEPIQKGEVSQPGVLGAGAAATAAESQAGGHQGLQPAYAQGG
eukprot:5978016-Pleurochrysis_carterae.AAC.1